MSEIKRYQNPDVQDHLAAQYVTGTLRGPARRRMERLMRQYPSLRNRVRHWESQLQPLHNHTPSLLPDASVWAGITAAIHGRPDTQDTRLERLKKRLNLYRLLSGGALAFSLLLAALLTVQLQQPTSTAVVNYVAVMKDPGDQPTMVVTLSKEGRALSLDMLQKPVIADNHVLHLWAISKDDGNIRSLGTVPVEKHIEKTLTKPQWGMISSAEHLIVSVETSDRVSAPGPNIIAKGLCVKVEGWQAKT